MHAYILFTHAHFGIHTCTHTYLLALFYERNCVGVLGRRKKFTQSLHVKFGASLLEAHVENSLLRAFVYASL
jgi:hypothetical protein